MNSDRPKFLKDLPEALKGVLEGVPRTSFSRRSPRTQEESESAVLWEVKDLDDLAMRTARAPALKK